MANEAARQQSQLNKLSGGGDEVTMRGSSDTKRLQAVIAATALKEEREEKERLDYEAKLKAVTVSKDDIFFLFKQFDITVPLADRALRLNGGNLLATIDALLTPTAVPVA
jgi:NACalpha-BTF3-like transcription factor